MASLVAQTVKNLPTRWETWVWYLGWKDTLEEGWNPLQYSCLNKNSSLHGQRSLAGYSPRSYKGSDTTERLSDYVHHRSRKTEQLNNLSKFFYNGLEQVFEFMKNGSWQPTPVFLPGESHGQRSVVGYCPWDDKSRTQLSDQTTTRMAQETIKSI